uniref:Putative secreted protein n=1 Tax=Anopheles marajoara TaxID=58244 RepID=A0A2M4CDV0_9DIPT
MMMMMMVWFISIWRAVKLFAKIAPGARVLPFTRRLPAINIASAAMHHFIITVSSAAPCLDNSAFNRLFIGT